MDVVEGRRRCSWALIIALFALLLRFSFGATADRRFVRRVVRDNAFVADEPAAPMLEKQRLLSTSTEKLYLGHESAFVRDHPPKDVTTARTQHVGGSSVTELPQFAVLSRPELIPRAITLPYRETSHTS